jgi:hypothetical protein
MTSQKREDCELFDVKIVWCWSVLIWCNVNNEVTSAFSRIEHACNAVSFISSFKSALFWHWQSDRETHTPECYCECIYYCIQDLMILWSAYAAQDMVRHKLPMATFTKLPDPTTPPHLWSTDSSSRGFICYTATALITQCSRFKTSADGHQRRMMCTVWLAPIRQIKNVDTWSSKKRRYSPLD